MCAFPGLCPARPSSADPCLARYRSAPLPALRAQAAKYTHEGSITLSATVVPSETTASDAVCLRFVVEDTGVGVPSGCRSRIFEVFQQAGQSPSSARPGTGLGLPLCRSLVALMGGRLDLVTPPPEATHGSTFAFTCMVTRSQRSPKPQPCEAEKLPAGLRALIADDVKMNRKMLIRALSSVLPEPLITEAESGEAALELLLNGEHDVAFLDENFAQAGELKGSDVMRLVRQHERARAGGSRGRRLVLVGVSGDQGRQEYDEAATKAGCDVVWGKPIPTADEMRKQLHAVRQAGL